MIVVSYAQMLTLMLHAHNNCSTVLPLLAKEIHISKEQNHCLSIGCYFCVWNVLT